MVKYKVKLIFACIFLFCLCKLQAQEETVITMITNMEIGKELSFRLESEKWVSDTIRVAYDLGNGELHHVEIPRIDAIFSYDFFLIVRGKTIKFYLPSDFIEAIHCPKAELTALDVSECKKLKILNCSENLLTALDVSNNTQLLQLVCEKNSLTTLDLSKNTQLKFLNCSENSLTTLDVSKNIQLDYLYCSNNSLITLDMSNNKRLQILWCYSNSLTTLNLSGNTQLLQLRCFENALTALDLSESTQLDYLECEENLLTTLDLSKNTQLKELRCSENKLTTLDLSKNLQLSYLDCLFNNLTYLDISQNIRLRNVSYDRTDKSNKPMKIVPTVYNQSILADDDKLIITMTTTLEPGSEIQMDILPPRKNNLDERNAYFGFYEVKIDYGSGRFVKRSYGDKIKIPIEDSIIKFYASTDFTAKIKCSNLQLTALDVSNFTGLTELDCSNNNLTSLDLSQNPKLEKLFCYQNRINRLDLSHNPQIINLNCSSNNLSELELSNSPQLERLVCSDNNLSELDLSRNPQLNVLECSNNQLSELDLSKNPKLESLYCSKNSFTALDLSNNPLVWIGENLNVVVKMPDRRKSELTKRRDRNQYSRDNDYFGFSFGGGYTAMPFTQRDNRSHYQSVWHLDVGAIFNPEGYYWRSSDIFHLITLEGSINFLSMRVIKELSRGGAAPRNSKKVLPSLTLGYTLNYDFFNWLLVKSNGYGLDLKVAASPNYINPTIGINMLNFLKLNVGYSFGIKPFYDTQLSGFTIGIAVSIGTYPFNIID